MDKERRGSKDFLFPDENLLHRRRQSADYHNPSASQSEDEDSVGFEVKEIQFNMTQSALERRFGNKLKFMKMKKKQKML
jgi:hypothetical protein